MSIIRLRHAAMLGASAVVVAVALAEVPLSRDPADGKRDGAAPSARATLSGAAGSADAEAAGLMAEPPLPRPAPAALVPPIDPLASALGAAADGDWVAADVAIAAAPDPLAREILAWVRLRDGAGRWSDYETFLAWHPNWPGLATLRRAGERLIPESASPAEVLAYFGDTVPQTGRGVLRHAAALIATGRPAEAEAEVVRGWRELSLSPGEQAAFRDGWGEVIEAHHAARLDMLLWQGWTREAEAMLPLVSPDLQALARARIATRRDAEGLQAAIWAVPESLKADPGLAYERYRYRVTKGRWDEAESALRAASTSADALGRPEMWMERRANLARQALARGDVDGAYAIAAGGFGSAGPDYADAEWLAGYIALERMNDPARAAEHFRRFDALVATPVSRGRAGYWLGRALAAAGDSDGAAAAWRAGGAFQTSFYGQLAAEEAGLPPDGRLVGHPEAVAVWQANPAVGSSVVRAAVLLHAAGQDERAIQFLRQAAEGAPAGDRSAIAAQARALDLPQAAVRIGKDAAAEGLILPEEYFPLDPIARKSFPVPTEYALAIARQESEFNPGAVSTSGARGLMQLMPATAAHMADVAGVPFDLARLGQDPAYNARLGTEYLRQMLARYRGSYILATAAYNAGPGRVDSWLVQNGDPRPGAASGGVDPVDWIEAIPYSETRNYVMRVMEALHVYRIRLDGAASPARLSADLTRTG